MGPEICPAERTFDFVDVALPCYNVAPLLDDFMNSLLAAMDRPWRIVARDDGSADGTGEQLAKWASRLGPRMLLLKDEEFAARNLGLIGNYNAVLAATTAPYILTGDSDDVWLPGHVSTVLHALRRIEGEKGGNAAIAVGTDAIVVDLNLQHTANSYWRWSRVEPRDDPTIAMVAMESAALGSTMAVNRALLELALPIPDGAAYQDWWLAMVAAAFGSLRLLPEPTILYRRHGANATKEPVLDFRKFALVRLLKNPLIPKRRIDFLLDQSSRQARAFLDRYTKQLPASDIEVLTALVTLNLQSPLARRAMLLRHGLMFSSRLKNLGLLALI